ncbi:hypothetical protein L2E82_11863 [Cichorium intybus]|uniref:Uncharacterized protein n=1 Tax=Cichorium intybus TaxID=13427 RepID=A0ACB9GED4_CICIN|nr:hypothetical protein L2E82_11863 [Cichorium intybus]
MWLNQGWNEFNVVESSMVHDFNECETSTQHEFGENDDFGDKDDVRRVRVRTIMKRKKQQDRNKGHNQKSCKGQEGEAEVRTTVKRKKIIERWGRTGELVVTRDIEMDLQACSDKSKFEIKATTTDNCSNSSLPPLVAPTVTKMGDEECRRNVEN